MHRLLADADAIRGDCPRLSDEALAHMRVLRLKDGEEIELFDGCGLWRRYVVANASRAELSPTSPAMSAERPSPLVLFACVTKGSRWDWTVEKATELGVTRIVPVISARTIVRVDAKERESKRSRWTRIAADAARQSDAKWIPEVLAPVSFEESLSLVKDTACLVGALTTPPPRPIADAVRELSAGRDPAVYVGPEGDFTPDELARLIEIATPVSFGSTILRAETAAIYGVSVLKAALDSCTSS